MQAPRRKGGTAYRRGERAREFVRGRAARRRKNSKIFIARGPSLHLGQGFRSKTITSQAALSHFRQIDGATLKACARAGLPAVTYDSYPPRTSNRKTSSPARGGPLPPKGDRPATRHRTLHTRRTPPPRVKQASTGNHRRQYFRNVSAKGCHILPPARLRTTHLLLQDCLHQTHRVALERRERLRARRHAHKQPERERTSTGREW